MKTKTKTKTKPALCARKMFANYYPRADGFVCLHGTRTCAKANAADDYSHAAVPVAVIPLRDPYALGDAMVSALTAIGVLPRKGGRK